MKFNQFEQINWQALSKEERRQILCRKLLQPVPEMVNKVERIIQQVKNAKTGGDQALLELTQKYDRVKLESMQVSNTEIERAKQEVDPESYAALQQAAQNIRRFHRSQLNDSLRIETQKGVICERIYRPIQKVGLYAPGGTAPLPSTVLMLGIPAQIAGVNDRILCSPPSKDGSINPYILVAADLCGIKKIYKVGGAQSIAAMAYGTETIPKVDKILGPGNSWVTLAKMAVAQDGEGAAIDMPAGPSEVLVIADKSANPEFVAADLLAQAEHGPDSQVILVSTDSVLLTKAIENLQTQLTSLPRRAIALDALTNSRFILASNIDTAVEISNQYAPEHLIIHCQNPRSLLPQINNAGSIFLGSWSPESVGDYASGTNHVLPTNGYARNSSGVSLDSFLKKITVQELSPVGLKELGPVVERLSLVEGLHAHKEAVSVRLKQLLTEE